MNARRTVALILAILFLWAFPSLLLAQEEDSAPPGLIAYVGADFNIYTTDANASTTIQLTTDGGIGESLARLYQWPTWSTDGRLAYFLTELERGGGLRTHVLISPDGAQAGISAHVFEDDSFTYAYWSPQNCETETLCRDLAVLLSRQSAGGFVVELVRDRGDVTDHILTDRGTPFYFSWSPDGTQMFWHRNNSLLDVYGITEAETIGSVDVPPGFFAAPAWSPVDDRLLFATLDIGSGETSLSVREGERISPLTAGLQGPIAFAWSPDGSKIAYTDRQGALMVIDSVSGEEISRTEETGVLAFFWSPDGQKLAYLTLIMGEGGSFSAQAESRIGLASMIQTPTGVGWSILDLSGGENRHYGGFVPTQSLIYLLTYFDQFGQSHRLWSPDSRYLVYAELRDENREVISILDTSQAVGVPFIIADGSIGIWSYQ